MSVNVMRLLTFGGLSLESDDGSAVPRLRPAKLGLLAVVAAHGDHGISRERLASLFWPESDEEHARQSLRQSLYALRQEVGRDVARSGATVSLEPSAITSDVADFREALAGGDRARACAFVRGPFLDGFYLAATPEFERWVEEERARLQGAATAALTALAAEATTSSDRDAAVEWWRQLTTVDPLSGRFALGYLKALAARGDRAQALAFARTHEEIVRRELEADSDPSVRLLEAELRAIPSPDIPRSAPPLPARPASRASNDLPNLPTLPTLPTPLPTSAPAASNLFGEEAPPDEVRVPAPRPSSRRRLAFVAGASVLGVSALATIAWQRGWLGNAKATTSVPTFAVGLIREDGVPDTLRIGGVLTDMLGTNLARVEGLSVLANSRLFELLRPGQDTSAAGYADAARRAGATELLEGRLLAGPRWGLALEIQRVDLRTGLLKSAYRVSATDRYALIDSATAAIAHHLNLGSPRSSVAEATTASPVAYRLYEEGLRAYYQYDAPAAQRLMRAALGEDSTFAMAAYYESLLAGTETEAESRRRALQLARRAPERERLTITADVLSRTLDPNAIAVAETLTIRYPNDPRAFATLAASLQFAGEWPRAAAAVERAIAIDSAAELAGKEKCRLCDDFMQLADIYLWWDSLAAADRTAQRFLKARPASHLPWALLTGVAAKTGRSAEAIAHYQRFAATNPNPNHLVYELRLHLNLELYDELERGVRPLLTSLRSSDFAEGHWLLLMALRNQGRLRDATHFLRTGRAPGLPDPIVPHASDEINEAVLALESGEAKTAVSILERRRHVSSSTWFPGLAARYLAWSGTLLGTALAAVGDTLAVLRMADTVELWGQRSSFGRDRKAHHFLRGLVLAAAGHDNQAVGEFRAAIHSWTLGYTRANYEMARALMRLGKPRDAVAALQPALRGDIDAANLYVTRSDLHELLAQAFDAAGQRDSAAVHYRTLVKAWARADPAFHERRDRARQWLERLGIRT